MKKEDYYKKLQEMIDDGIAKGIYTPTKDTTLSDLNNFQSFLRRNFKDKYAKYEEMRPMSS